MKDVYIVNTAAFLPNEPVENDAIEQFLGTINQKESLAKNKTLAHNQIKKRYYALNHDATITHTNAALASQAISALFGNNTLQASDVELLACGTSVPDQISPSHAMMVHGLLPEFKNVEVVSTAGNCCSSMQALKYIYLAIKSSDVSAGVCSGSELLSPLMLSKNFDHHVQHLKELDLDPIIEFEKDFLRFMLSDGAGAFLLANRPMGQLPLKIEWIESVSFANEFPACMYLGAKRTEQGDLISWKGIDPSLWTKECIFSFSQDTKLLHNITSLGATFFQSVFNKHQLLSSEIDYFVVHLSSMYFKEILQKDLLKMGIDIPFERWFTVLEEVGNIGSAYIYVALDALVKQKKLLPGNKILLGIPESARFSYAAVLLTVCG